MAIRLRMAMHGRAHKKVFHIVAIDSKLRRDAKPTELLGIYDPHSTEEKNPRVVRWSVDRLRYWLGVGAVPSNSVAKLLQLGQILQPGSPYDPHTKLLPKHPVEHARRSQLDKSQVSKASRAIDAKHASFTTSAD